MASEKLADTLTDVLHAKADAELMKKLNELWKPITDEFYKGLNAGEMDHVAAEKLSLGGYGTFNKEVWPPQVLVCAKDAMFQGKKRTYRSQYVKAFCDKVNALESEVQEVRDIAESARNSGE